MHDAIRQIGKLAREAETELVTLQSATVRTLNPFTVRGADGSNITPQRTQGWHVNPGDQVLTLRVGTTLWAIGPVTEPTPPPPTGIVASVSGSLATVTLGAPFGSMAMPSTVTVTNGQRVGIVWHHINGEWAGFIAGVLLTNPAPAPPPPPPPGAGNPDVPPVEVGPMRVSAAATATWRQGWRSDTTNLYQGNAGSWSSYPYPQSGYWFYGHGAFDDHAGLTCQTTTIRVRVISGAGASGAVRVRFRLHTSPTRPGGLPVLVGSEHAVDLAPGSHTVSLPEAFGQAFIDKTAAGVAIVSTSTGEYRGVYGIAEDSQSGHLTITST